MEDLKEASSPHLTIISGRPDLPKLVRDLSYQAEGRVGVTICGPEAFTREARNAVAGVQLDILKGLTKCDEMYMQTETYSW